MLKKIELPPGLNKESSQYAASGYWYDANNIRFRGGVPETVGGWQRDGTYELEGIGRVSFSSHDFAGNNYQYAGTSWKWYAITGSQATDITPHRKAVVEMATNPFAGEDPATSVVVVTDDGHGASVNDFVVFADVAAFGDGGDVTIEIINRASGFQIFEVINDSSYKIDVGVVTGSTTPGGGASVGPLAYYKVSSGISAQVFGQGYGAGSFGGDTFPTIYDLVTDPVTTNTGAGTENQISVEYTTPGEPSTIAATDQFYLYGLTGTIGGIPADVLNDQWWSVLPASSSPDAVLQTEQDATGIATGGGADGKYYFYDASEGAVDGATRAWGENSNDQVLVGEMRRCYMDNYGEDIMFANSGGPIYYWDISANTSGGTPLGAVTVGNGEAYVGKSLGDSTFTGNSGTPTVVDSFLVSKKDGHVVALGCNDLAATDLNSLLVRWSDQNNPFNWTPGPSNTAGGQVLRIGSRILGGVSTKDEVVIFTDAAVYSMRFVGPPDIFSFNLITDDVQLVAGNTAVVAANSVFFMANDGFYTYSGAVAPLQSTVAKYVFDDFNFDQNTKSFGALNSAFSEVSWFYPSRDSFEPNRYATFNYEEGSWSAGSYDMSALSRGSASSTSYSRNSWRDSQIFQNPMSTYLVNWDPTTLPETQKSGVMLHESGLSAQGGAMSAFIESGEFDISDGERFALYSRMIPDVQLFNNSSAMTDPVISVAINGRDFPGSSSSQLNSTDLTFSRSNSTYTPVGNATAIRGRARSVSVKLSSNASGFAWRVGAMRFDLRPDGRR